MDRYELIEFFGVIPEINEDDCYELFRVSKNDLILEIAFLYSSGFSLLLFQKHETDPMFSMSSEGDVKIERLTYKNNYDCLNLTFPYTETYGEENWNYSYTVRIFIEPKIKVEIIK